MPQFFIKDLVLKDGTTVIRGDDFHHLVNVRRITQGNIINIRDLNGKGYKARVTELSGDEITLGILEETGACQCRIEINLYLCLIKGGGFESAIQKAVEVGVERIIPVVSERTIPDPMKKSGEKIERWNRIAIEAAKQCMRATIPEVVRPVHFNEAAGEPCPGIRLIAHPGAETGLHAFLLSVSEPDSVNILVGPEGGFSPREIELACEKSWVPVSCGPNHLRAETAAVVLPSLVLYHWG